MSNLKNLRINQEGILPSFDKEIHDYYLTISEDIYNLQIEAIPENINSKVEILGNNNFKNGENLVKIIVKGETDEVYNIYVNKVSNLNLSNANLENLAVENELLNPPFNSNITEYCLEISNDIDSLNILAIPENENSKIEVVGESILNIGNNLIKVIVTSENNSVQKIYEINVYKKTKKETEEYNKIQQESYENAQELLKENYNIDNGYNTEKTSIMVTQYKSNNEIIKIVIFISIVFILLIFVILIKDKVNKRK